MRRKKKRKQCLCKPGSVSLMPLDNSDTCHSSNAQVTLRLEHSTLHRMPGDIRTGSPQTVVYANLQPPVGTAG